MAKQKFDAEKEIELLKKDTKDLHVQLDYVKSTQRRFKGDFAYCMLMSVFGFLMFVLGLFMPILLGMFFMLTSAVLYGLFFVRLMKMVKYIYKEDKEE
jgi:hypothetical protein